MQTLEQIFTGFYVFEMSIKLYIYRLPFFRVGWNIFGSATPNKI
jgi:hypothetical protein